MRANVKQLVAACALFASLSAFAGDWRIGATASSLMPQGGSDVSGGAGAGLVAGFDLSENFGFDAELLSYGHHVQLSGECLWRWQGLQLYNDLFGYSRFDPFFTAGCAFWLGRGDNQMGPKAGLGAYYHLDNNWSLKADADCSLALDGCSEAVFSVSAGVIYSF